MFLTSNVQDAEAQKHVRVDPGRDDLNAKQQSAESRYQKKDLDTKKET